jgi:hypothetical protein
MRNHEQINLLVKWIQNLDSALLHNEDDVETKFVLPFFRLLGYLDTYRRGKFPLKTHNPGKSGRKLEPDQVYFATEKYDEQKANTCLIIVEAKKPQENLDEAFQQALLYGSYLEPILYVMTNGTQVKVIKRKRFRDQEIIFDIDVNAIVQREIAEEFHKQLNFNTLKSLNENISNASSHNQYVLLEKSLQRHPDIKEILDAGDFKPAVKSEPRKLTVIKPKVAISCRLPIGFNGGSCQIKFSSITLRGLTLHLSHLEIMGSLMTGLNTKPEWATRRFIKPTNTKTYEVSLGNTSFLLTHEEALELCECIDEVFSVYKTSILKAEIALECCDFQYVPIKDMQTWGFQLFSVKKRLWNLMCCFATHFSQNEPGWNFFQPSEMELIIRPKMPHSVGVRYQALVRPVTENVSDEYVNLLYQIPYEYDLKSIEEHIESFGGANSWRDSIGTQGFWTVKYTKQWLLEKFIPKVINFFDENHQRLLDDRCKYYKPLFLKHYKPLFQDGYVSNYQDCFDWFDEIRDLGEHSNSDISLKEVNDVKQLIPYIVDLETLIARYPQGISSSLLRPYYKTFTKLCRRANPPFELLDQFDLFFCEDRKPKAVQIESIAGNVYAAESVARTLEIGKGQSENLEWLEWTVEDVLNGLQRQVVRIDAVEFEKSCIADYLSRSFKAILGYWNVQCSQAELNVAKQALLPLLEEGRFEDHYVITHQKQFIEISELEF